MKTPQEEGREFEREFAEEMGLDKVPGSGSQWFSKLDVKGKGARWSLKSSRVRIRVDDDLIDEAIAGCDDGSIPMWAFRIPSGDFVMMFKDDFKAIQAGEIVLVETKQDARAQRKKRADTPVLLREKNEDAD